MAPLYILFTLLASMQAISSLHLSSSIPEPKVTRILTQNDRVNKAPASKSSPLPLQKGRAAPFTPKGINYNGGSVMSSGVNVYLVWYGTWNSAAQKSIVQNFVRSLNPNSAGSVSGWWAINSRYFNGQGAYVSSNVKLAGEFNDNKYSQGYTLSTVRAAYSIYYGMTISALPIDPNGVYLVLSSSDVKMNGFCTSFCGWHTYMTVNGVYIKFAFIGNSATQCPGSCSMSAAPNGDRGVDGMISVLAHELTETVTDPLMNAWYDGRGNENADKCAWSFGSYSGSSNMVGLNNQPFLVQLNWDPVGGACVATAKSSFPPPKSPPSPPPKSPSPPPKSPSPPPPKSPSPPPPSPPFSPPPSPPLSPPSPPPLSPPPSPPLPPCDVFLSPSGTKAFSLASAAAYRVGTFITLYRDSQLDGVRSRFESAYPGECEENQFSPVNSLKIEWNENADSGYDVGCKSVSLWTGSGCTGKKYTIELSSFNFNFTATVVNSIRLLESETMNWTNSIKSVGCNK